MSAMRALNILVIDDSLTICRYLDRLLTRMGHHVTTTTDATRGLQLWRERQFDLILLDLMLPDMDGISILKEIRSRDQETCIVMVTGHGNVKTAIEAVRQGADGYVEKDQIGLGSDLDEFLHVIERALEIRESQIKRIHLEQEIRRKNEELEAMVKELQRARNALQEERNKLREILFSLSELVIVVDREGRVLLMNPLAEKELGVSQEEAVGKPLSTLSLHPEVLDAMQRAMENGETIRKEIAHLTTRNGSNGRVFSASINPVRMRNQELLGVAIILRDISQEKELERMKADFYSMITHDLRSPAMAIIGFVDLLAQEAVGPLNKMQKEIVESIQRSVRKLLELINDFLDYSAIDAGFLKLERQEVDLREVIHEAVSELQPLAQQRQHTVEVRLPEEPTIAWVDGERIGQVVTNLLSNAIKYTPDGGHIVVSLTHSPEHFILEVSDNGIGIPEDQISLLFSKYKRVNGDCARRIKGTGLGLLIVKEIVKAHGGEVSVESKPGEGSTFRVTLPCTKPESQPSVEQISASICEYVKA
ncbi:MAG TPA: response regulator [Caldilineae bacterium]|nr:response regulator [Caldilineae bacterium]